MNPTTGVSLPGDDDSGLSDRLWLKFKLIGNGSLVEGKTADGWVKQTVPKANWGTPMNDF